MIVLPALLILLSTAAAALMAYGTDPVWAQQPWGIRFIIGVYQWQWPLATISLLLCLGMMGMVVGGKCRAWWLIALGPILALFVQRFHSDPYRHMAILDNPQLAAAGQAAVRDEEMVVGVLLSGEPYAYPYRALYAAPVVVQASRDNRVTMLLMWSPFANRAQAFSIGRELKPRDLVVVSMPANALLLYNSRLGQFINGLTGQTNAGQRPAGFLTPIPTRKTTWGAWREAHPTSKVLEPAPGGNAPSVAIQPIMPMPPQKLAKPADTRIVIIATTRPTVVEAAEIGERPLNVSSDENRVLLLRDPQTHVLRAFDRQIDADLFPQFELRQDPVLKTCLIDSDTNTLWSLDGKALKGPCAEPRDHPKTLRPLPVEEGLTWGVMKLWMPALELASIAPPTTSPSRPQAESPGRGTSVRPRRGR